MRTLVLLVILGVSFDAIAREVRCGTACAANEESFSGYDCAPQPISESPLDANDCKERCYCVPAEKQKKKTKKK